MTDKEDIEIYAKYKEKHGLPEYDKVHKFLELNCLEDDGLLLLNIKKKLVDKIKCYLDIIDPIVHPDTTMNSMYESRFFDEDEKGNILSIFKHLMALHRKADLTALDESDESNARFIREFFKAFPEIRSDLEKIIKRLGESWEQEDTSEKDKIGYLG